MDVILAPSSVGISELKVNPNAVIEAAEGMPVAVLNRNKPVAYLLPAAAWEAICDRLEDIELKEVAEQRLADGKAAVEVRLDDL
ncbi:type II toxin-antitoxin system Phd/YefM family antitoxin [Crenobacter cavernae]|uniref:Antitoxin n=1 Tax=Crenobacter cavernae TaxID=2290923 RepID=A0A345Y3J6_9NEIS|nr:type II toxin-antitoxin system prevent-host-death family antitoxin [Crenobacter cavernae]AXK38498.1 type II toxin-antitoxin system prevent-host-death family antitoxin [Crenobacter cavernae]